MYKISILNDEGYVHARVSGVNQILNIVDYWRKIADICSEKGTKRIVVEDCLIGHVGEIEIYQLYKSFTKKTGIPVGSRIAIVYPKERVDSMGFAVTVMTNWSGINLRHFTDIEPAKLWLLDD